MNPNPKHCAECGALHRLKESLERIDLARNPTIDRDTTANLLLWFKFTGEAETSLVDFLAYAEAIGCHREPDLTTEFLNQKFAGLRAKTRPESEAVVHGAIDRRVTRLIGTYQDRALRAFENLYRPKKEIQS